MKKKKKKRISLNKHGEANKPTPPNTTRMPYGPLLDSLPHLDEYTQKTQSNKLPQAKKTTTRKKKTRFFFFASLCIRWWSLPPVTRFKVPNRISYHSLSISIFLFCFVIFQLENNLFYSHHF